MSASANAAASSGSAETSASRYSAPIFDALDAVLSLNQDDRPTSQILAQLDRLLETTRAYFDEEEKMLAHAADDRTVSHLEVHRLILDYIVNLRSHADRFERTRLLPQLRFLDYWLTTHISEQVTGQAPA